MRKFNVNVNGTAFEVHVEEIGGQEAATAPAAAAAAPSAAPAAAGQEIIAAPMPGSILDVRVSAGDAVTAGQVVLILEAMKMENELSAISKGVVKQVAVDPGDSVQGGQLLISLDPLED